MIRDLLVSVFGFLWSLITSIAQIVFAIAAVLLAIVAAYAFYEWFSGKQSRKSKAGLRPEILFPRIGEWTQRGCDAFAQDWKALCLGSCVACTVTALSLGILAGPMTAGLTQMSLAAVRGNGVKPSLDMLWSGFAVSISSILYVVAGILLGFCGAYVLMGLGTIGEYLVAPYVAVMQTVLMFGMFFIADQRANVFSALSKSAIVVSWGPFVFLMLYAVAAALGTVGGVFFGVGAVLTLPIQLCVLGAAYDEIVAARETASTAATAAATA